MTEFKIGDIVRLTKGEPDTPGHGAWVLVVTSGDLSAGTISLCALRAFEDAGGKIELIERPLPTTPNTLGWATAGGGHRIVRRNAGGTWNFYDERGFAYVIDEEDLPDFTEAVLIPKTLADKIIEWAADPLQRGRTIGGVLEQIADHLKGQGDE